MKRYALLACLLFTQFLPFPVAAQPSQLTGRPIVIFIHGRNQAWETGNDLEARWFGALSDGLEKLSPNAQSEDLFRSLIPEQDRALVRYERVYEPGFKPSAECGGMAPSPVGILAAKQYELTTAIQEMRQLASQTGMTQAEDVAFKELETAAETTSKAVDFGQSASDSQKAGALSHILHAIRNGAAKVLGAGPATAFLNDTKLYLQKGPHHCETNLRLRNVLDGATAQRRPIILVSHSMGAMVSLDQLWRSSGANYKVVRFVSLGSQLGMQDLLRYLAGAGANQPLLPNTIRDWVNIKGTNDLLGFNVAKDTVRFVQGGPVSNLVRDTGSVSDAHSISRYLQLSETAHAVADAYCTSFAAGGRPAECSQISSFPLPE